MVKETAKKLDQENNKDAKNKFYVKMLLQGKKEELKLESIRQQIKDTNLQEIQLRNTYERHKAVQNNNIDELEEIANKPVPSSTMYEFEPS